MKRIKNIKKIGKGKVHDIMVENVHHYMGEDGIIHHNTGLIYSASTILMLSKAKYKTGDEDSDLSLGQSGVTVTAKSEKNRLAKPSKIKFIIDFTKGCNPYDYLEHFCTPENFEKVGIAKGKMEVDKETGEMTFKPGGTRWYIRHLDKSVFGKNLNNAKVFTPEVLESLEPIIQDYFSYKSVEEMEEVENESELQEEYSDVDIDDVDGTDLFG